MFCFCLVVEEIEERKRICSVWETLSLASVWLLRKPRKNIILEFHSALVSVRINGDGHVILTDFIVIT